MTTGMEIMEAASQAVSPPSPDLRCCSSAFYSKAGAAVGLAGVLPPLRGPHSLLARLIRSSRHPLHWEKYFGSRNTLHKRGVQILGMFKKLLTKTRKKNNFYKSN